MITIRGILVCTLVADIISRSYAATSRISRVETFDPYEHTLLWEKLVVSGSVSRIEWMDSAGRVEKNDKNEALFLDNDQFRNAEAIQRLTNMSRSTPAPLTLGIKPDPELHADVSVNGPGEIEEIHGLKTWPYTLAIDLVRRSKGKGKETWRLRYREKLWLVNWPGEKANTIDPRLLSLSAAGDSGHHCWVMANDGSTLGWRVAFFALSDGKEFDEILKFPSELSRLAGERAHVIGRLAGFALRRVVTCVTIYYGNTVSFAHQERETVRSPPSGSFFSPPDLFAGVLLEAVDLLRPIHHKSIPLWILDVDPQFAEYGGYAERRELMIAGDDLRSP